MKFDFNISNNISGYAEILLNGIFHIRIAPAAYADKISALDKYGYLEKLPADENVAAERNDYDILKIKTAEETHNYSLSIQTVLSMHICISLMW